MTLFERIMLDENRYSNFINECADRICENSHIKLILVAGPSCSGKTTTTHKLSDALFKRGKQAYTISIDDFYLNPKDMPLKEDGKPDFEAIESFDIEGLHDCLHKLSCGECADIPHFDFTAEKRTGVRCTIRLDDKSIAIIEGLHALNPIIYKNFVSEDKIFKIFLDCHSDTPSTMRYSRLMRRLVRDYHYRNSDAQKTFMLWENVLAGDKKYIYPFEHLADIKINTRFGYESAVLRGDAIEILKKLPADSIYTEFAKVMIDYLSGIESIPENAVPHDSLLQEFIG